MQKERISRQVRAGNLTYFIDVERAKETGQPYLKITESRFMGEGVDWQRSSIVVFPEESQPFVQAVSEMAAELQRLARSTPAKAPAAPAG